MLEFDCRASEALNALFEELQSQVRFVVSQLFAHGFDENGVIAGNTQSWNKNIKFVFFWGMKYDKPDVSKSCPSIFRSKVAVRAHS